MSDAVLPHYPGFKVEIERAPVWNTRRSPVVAGRSRRVRESVYPIWDIQLSIEALRALDAGGSVLTELEDLCGFFNLHGGGFESFLYEDPDDKAVTDFQFGVRDGAETEFQLLRSIGFGSRQFLEPVQNVHALTNIKSNGVALTSPTDYTIDSDGLVTLAAAGTVGHVLTWTGTYYWRVCFAEDKLPFNRKFKGIWELQKLRLTGSVMNKV